MNKGFTLIELLAVIVILAIIALIAVPIILNIVEDSKEQSVKSSAQLYVDGLIKKIASENLINEFNPSSCTIINSGVLCDGTSLNYTVDGQTPTSGFITLNNGIVTNYTLNIGDYTVTKSGNNITTTSGNVEIHIAYALGQLIQYDPVNNTACTTGNTCYKWRVMTVDDTTSNTDITLQMDHNLVNLSTWVSKADYNNNSNYGTYGRTDKGPITVFKALETATSSWDNSLKLTYSYNTSAATNNYGTLSCTNGTCTVAGSQITSNLKARIITGEEITAITKTKAAEGTNAYNWTLANGAYYYFSSKEYTLGTKTAVSSGQTGNTELSWLVENTTNVDASGATANTYGDNNLGYWALSPVANDVNDAWAINRYGSFYNAYSVANASSYGIRPVITISKSIFE